MALTSVLRMFRLPVVVLSLVLFIGLFLLTTSDAWAYADGLPAKEMVQDRVEGDPDTPGDFTGGHSSSTCFDGLDGIRLIISTFMVSGLLPI